MDVVSYKESTFVSKKTWIIFTVIVVGLLTALVISSRSSNPDIDVSNIPSSSVLAASTASGNIADQVFGNRDSKVILVEYADFQCPACGSAHPGLKTLTEQYKGQIAFVFRNFPLSTIHPNARAASAAAESAGLQGKYWEMHNSLFENQNAWSDLQGNARTDAFVSYAKTLGLDTAKFTTDLASTDVNQKISFDQAIGKKLGVDSTPTFYLNGTKVESDVVSDIQNGTGQKLRTLIDEQLIKAGIALPVTE